MYEVNEYLLIVPVIFKYFNSLSSPSDQYYRAAKFIFINFATDGLIWFIYIGESDLETLYFDWRSGNPAMRWSTDDVKSNGCSRGVR